MRIIIAGGRDFNNFEMVEQAMERFQNEVSEIVCGDARGADSLGADWAFLHAVPVAHFPADWEKYGKAAGHIRNRQMAEYADLLVAFWDGKSKGTKNMIDTMSSLGKHGIVIKYQFD